MNIEHSGLLFTCSGQCGAFFYCVSGVTKSEIEKTAIILYDKQNRRAGQTDRAGFVIALHVEVSAVTCQEAERMVTPYINDELSGEEVEAFLRHLETCVSCQEELEIYFMVDVGLKQLDRDSGAFDIAGALKEKIEDSYARVGRLRLLKTLGCAVRTLQVMAVAVTVLLQFRLWLWP